VIVGFGRRMPFTEDLLVFRSEIFLMWPLDSCQGSIRPSNNKTELRLQSKSCLIVKTIK